MALQDIEKVKLVVHVTLERECDKGMSFNTHFLVIEQLWSRRGAQFAPPFLSTLLTAFSSLRSVMVVWALSCTDLLVSST